MRLSLKGKEIAVEERPAANLVFLIDVSGSMGEEKKLPLLKESLKELVAQLNGEDRVGIVTYAGSSGIALESTPPRPTESPRSGIATPASESETSRSGQSWHRP